MNKQRTVLGAILAILGLVVIGLYAVGYLVGLAVAFIGVLLIIAGLVTLQRAMVKIPQVPIIST